MPVSRDQAIGSMSLNFSDGWVSKAVEQIDSRLGNPNWLAAWRCGRPGSHYWDIVVGGEATDAEKAEIRRMYQAAGWSQIDIKTSSENGERPGLTGIKFYE